MAINEQGGSSVYCARDFGEREMTPLYQAVRYLAKPFHTILDIGCSDLPASSQLITEGKRVVGLDLSSSALRSAASRSPQAMLAVADLDRFPIYDEQGKIDCVLALDVLEHFPRNQAIQLLTKLKEALPHRPLSIIVSMPIISPFSIGTWIAGAGVLSNPFGNRMGLFDSTHCIFTNRTGHREIFAEAGYSVVHEGHTTMKGTTENIDYPARDQTEQQYNVRRTGIKTFLIKKLIPGIVSPVTGIGREQIVDALMEYQGIYLLQARD